jgi:hypothetical protein
MVSWIRHAILLDFSPSNNFLLEIPSAYFRSRHLAHAILTVVQCSECLLCPTGFTSYPIPLPQINKTPKIVHLTTPFCLEKDCTEWQMPGTERMPSQPRFSSGHLKQDFLSRQFRDPMNFQHKKYLDVGSGAYRQLLLFPTSATTKP